MWETIIPKAFIFAFRQLSVLDFIIGQAMSWSFLDFSANDLTKNLLCSFISFSSNSPSLFTGLYEEIEEHETKNNKVNKTINLRYIIHSPKIINYFYKCSTYYDYTKSLVWSGRRDSNSRHLRWQRSALPLSYARINFIKKFTFK